MRQMVEGIATHKPIRVEWPSRKCMQPTRSNRVERPLGKTFFKLVPSDIDVGKGSVSMGCLGWQGVWVEARPTGPDVCHLQCFSKFGPTVKPSWHPGGVV